MTLVAVHSTRAVLSHPECDASLLSEPELTRAAAFRHAENRDDFIAGHALVRMLAARFLGVKANELTITQKCATCAGPHGKPELKEYPEVYVSLSHTRGTVSAAAGPRPVGVDVERVSQRSFADGLYDRVLAPAEVAAVRASPDHHLAFLRQWVRKEALVKLGVITLDKMGTLDLSDLPMAEFDGRTRLGVLPPWTVLDWQDNERGVVGAAVSDGPLDLAEIC